MRIKLIVILFFYSTVCSAQIAFKYSQSIPVKIEGESLSLPWAGGLNSPQYNTIDLDMDGVEDLVVYDRTSNRVNTFLSKDGSYSYAPEYAYFFPEDARGWLILRDYDCDDKKDIFTRGDFGVDVYRNVSSEFPSWELVFDPLNSIGTGSIIPMNISASDIPAIEDIDGDGDLDILTFGFNGGGIEFHKNFSVDRTGSCGDLDFERVTRSWGNFNECGCGSFAFDGEGCPPSGGRLLHIGGKSLLAYDMDGDNDMEIVLGEEDCKTLWLLENKGDAENPVFDDFVSFPNKRNPTSLNPFPAAYLVDVNFDDKKDLMVSPSISANSAFSPANLEASSWYYENQGDDENPNFQLEQQDFLQNLMLDQGSNSSVALIDEDGDGDLDMLTTSHGQLRQFSSYSSQIYLYRNIGTKAVPAYELVNEDYLPISFNEFKHTEMRIQFGDMNADGTQDIIIQAVFMPSATSSVYYVPNANTNSLNFLGQQLQFLNMTILSFDNPHFYDISGDGLVDLLLGKSNGNIEYHRNIGTGQAPNFQLETTMFYGKDNSFTNRNIIPIVGDLDGDGDPELVTTDDRGEVNIYEDFLNHLDDPRPGLNKVYFDPLTKSLSKTRMGLWARPVIADLYNSGTPVIAFGVAQGGMQILENADALPPGFGDSSDLLTIVPNPGSAFHNDGVVEISSKEPLMVRVISILGKGVSSPEEVTPTKNLKLSIKSFSSGIYIALGERNGKIVDRAKFVIAD